MGWDDTLSILYAMKRKDIDIAGIMVTGCGETNLRWGKVIARTLMELDGRTSVPVSIGADKPLQFDHVFPQSFRDDMNDLMGLLGGLNPAATMQYDSRPAWEFLADYLDKAKEPVRIISLGGFTNIAMMLQKRPDAKIENIEAIYAMAGAVFVDGNISLLNNARKEWDQGPVYATNRWAEFNVFVDPKAAKIVFDSTIPLTIVPLDACDYVMLSPAIVEGLAPKDDLAKLAKKILEQKTGSHDEGIPVPIFDPLATLIATHGMDTYQYTSLYLDVVLKETEKNNQCGRLVPADTGSRKINVVQGVYNQDFADEFSAVLNK